MLNLKQRVAKGAVDLGVGGRCRCRMVLEFRVGINI